jgi:hypothetical protein
MAKRIIYISEMHIYASDAKNTCMDSVKLNLGGVGNNKLITHGLTF